VKSSIPVSKVAKALVIDAEDFARRKKSGGTQEEVAAITYEMSDIFAQFFTS